MPELELTLGNGTMEADWVAGSHRAMGTRSRPSPLPLMEASCSCIVGLAGLQRHQGFTWDVA